MLTKNLCQSGCYRKFSAIVVHFQEPGEAGKNYVKAQITSIVVQLNPICNQAHQVQSREDKTPQRAIKNKSKASIATDYSNRCLGFAGLSNVSQSNLLIDLPWWNLATISGETTILIFPFQILSNLRFFMLQTTFANTFVGRKYNFTEAHPFI